MGPSKPALPPLKTPKSVTFPSELRENPQGESTRHREGEPTPISPPPAYTEFLRTFSPSFSSPSSAHGSCPRSRLDQVSSSSTSMPSSAMGTSFSVDAASKTGSAAMPSPAATPHSARELQFLQRLRIPDSAASPQTGRAMHSPFSPTEWRFRYAESPRSANGGAVSVRQTTTRRTVTLRYSTPPLDPPPKGKRRKTSEPRTPPRSP
jgi:hypothetical protein